MCIRDRSTTVAIDGVTEIHSELRAGQRLQTNLWSYRYYTAAQWTIFCSLVTSMVVKFRDMSRIWMSWGLVYHSGPTFRIGLATIHVASESIVSSKTAYEQLEEFKEEFKIIRGHRPIGATLKTFPSQPSAYSLLYPSQLPSFVDCRVDSKLIVEHACKEHIPIKANNARLTGKTTQTKAGIAAGGQDRDLMSEMLTFVLNRSPSSSPPPDRETSSANTAHVNQPRGASTLPIGNAAPLSLGDVNHDAEPPIVAADTEHVASHVASASSLAPDVKADGEPANKKARRGMLDHIDGLLVGYKNAKAAMKKPAGAKKGRKKVVENEEEDEEEEPEEETEEDDEAPIVEKHKAASKANAKSKAAAAKKAAAPAKPADAPPTVVKKTAGVEMCSSKFPPIDPKASVYWGGGRVYKASGNMVRVYARCEDRNDKRFSFKSKAALHCLLYTSPSPRDGLLSRMPSSA